MKSLKLYQRWCLFLLLGLLLVACGGGSGNEANEGDSNDSLIAQATAPSSSDAFDVENDGGNEVEETAEEPMQEPSEPIGVAPFTESPPPAQATPSATNFEDYGVNPFVMTNVDNLSTFSLDVDTGSFSLARRWLDDGLMPPADAVRVEEFVNYFEQGYSIPRDAAFAVYADGAPSPFHNDGTIFVRIGVQGYDVAEEDRKAAALTFVIDVSGSMAEGNRLGIVQESLHTLVNRLRPDDTVAIVAYNTSARVILNPTPASRRNEILDAIYELSPGGSTNLEEGLLLGYELANQAYQPGGINRVILASDGVANVGNTTADAILEQSRSYAEAGIYLTSIGVGLGNYNDVMLEQLADKGEGNYYYVDTLEEAETVFVDNLTSTLQVIALDAKIQVEFDPQVVAQYRLIGYENRAIADEDFRNDEVDAAEFGAGHTAAAIYAIQLHPGVQGRIATVNLRWQDPDSRQISEISGQFTTDNLATSFDAASPYLQLSILVAEFAELLRQSPYTGQLTLADVEIRVDRLLGPLDHSQKVTDFAAMVELAAALQR